MASSFQDSTGSAGEQERAGQLQLSRRNFIQVATGSLVMLPAVAGGFLMPFGARAEAADLGAGSFGDEQEPTTQIVVARNDQIGVVIADMTDVKGGQIPKPVPNAQVIITSHFNGQVIRGTTDEEGKLLCDIAGLSEDSGKEAEVPRYEFYGSVYVAAQGFRIFETGIMRITGGNGFSVPTRQVELGLPYPSRVSFDDWDVLYTSNEFVCSPENTMAHDLRIDLRDAVGTVDVGIYARGSQTPLYSQSVTAIDGLALASLKADFLKRGSVYCMAPGEEYEIRYAQGKTTYCVPISIEVFNPPLEAQKPLSESYANMSPFNSTSMFTTIKVPSSVPVIGGYSLTPWLPSFPFDFAFDPFGYFRVGISTPEWGYKSKDGKKDPNAWASHPRQTCAKQFNDMVDDMLDMGNKYLSASEKDKTFKQIEFTRSIYATAVLRLMAAGRWGDDDGLVRGQLQGQALLAFGFSFAENFMAGPVPFLIQFSVNANLTLGLGVAFVTSSVLDLDKYDWDYTNTGFNVTINVVPTLSIGVGIRGVASASLKGIFSLTIFSGRCLIPKGYEDLLENPHIIISYSASASVVLQFLFFSQSITLWSSGTQPIHNSWDDVLGSAEGLGDESGLNLLDRYDGMDLQQFLDEAKIVTSQSLAELAEFEYTKALQAAEPVPYDEIAQSIELKTEDGTPYQVTYYPFGAVEGVDELAAALSLQAGDGQDGESNDFQTMADFAVAQPSYEDYESIGAHSLIDESLFDEGKLGIQRLGLESGLVPSTDYKLFEGVLSDPRQKMVQIYGNTCTVRLAAVLVNGKPRTRLVLYKLLTGKSGAGMLNSYVLDFDPGIRGMARTDMFDYDFDFIANPIDDKHLELDFFVISGLRPREDETPLFDAASNQLFVYASFMLEWDYERPTVIQPVLTACAGCESASYDATGAGADFPYHNFSCPHITRITDTGSQGTSSCNVMSFLDRAGASPVDVLGDSSEGTRIGLGVLFADQWGIYKTSTGELISKVLEIDDRSIYEMTMSDRVDGWHTVMLRGNGASYYLLLMTNACGVSIGDDRYVPSLFAVLHAQTPDDSDRLRLVPWRGHSGFLASIDGRLQKASWEDLASGSPVLRYSECGPEGFEIAAFGLSDSGNFLYFPSSKVGTPGCEYDESSEEHPLPDVELYQIMTCRLRGDRFSEPFAFCEVGHPVDAMEVLAEDVQIFADAVSSFLSASVVDAEVGAGDIWFTSMPFTRCVTVLGCEAYAPIAYPGQSLPFLVTVRNDGNTYLKGFGARLKDVATSSSVYAHVDFSEETIVESCWNPEGDDGSLVGVEPDFSLAPGKTSAYKVWFTIPENWEGEKTAKIVVESIDKPVQLTGQTDVAASQEAAAELNSIEYIPDDSSVVAVFSMAARQRPVSTESLSDAPITVLGDSGSDVSPDKGGMADPTMAPGPLHLPKDKRAGSGGAGSSVGAGGANAGGAAGDVSGAAGEWGVESAGEQAGSSAVASASYGVPAVSADALGSTAGGHGAMESGTGQQTEELLPNLGIAGLAIGAAGAAFCAYSARRTQLQNERESVEGPDA